MEEGKTVLCPITGEQAVFYCQKEQGSYYINRLNGVIFLSPMPDVNDMLGYADGCYQEGVYKDYVEAKDNKLLTANVRLDQIAKYNPGKKMLDIGCAAGFFLEAAKKRGYEVNGIEFSASAIEQASPTVKEKIMRGDVHQEISRWQEKIDWVSAFDIIEHTHDPVKLVRDIKSILKPGGLLVMSSPDTGHYLRSVMRSHWPMLQPLQHTVLFSQKAIKNLLLSEGFMNVNVLPTYKYLTLEYLGKQLVATNRVLAYFMKLILGIFPKKIKEFSFKINIGEFIVFAQKSN